tara:strand:+ start:509 stop:1366 length:858 start_codon:yes stop_codon:yes gene_type:complete
VATGSKSIFNYLKYDNSLNSENLKDCHLIISLSETGFSLLLSDLDKRKILLLALKAPLETSEKSLSLDEIEDLLKSLPFKIDHCQSTEVLINFNKFSVVPEHLYSKGSGKSILAYTCRLEKGDHIYTDHWPNSEAMLIYALPLSVVEWCKKSFNAVSFRHQATAVEYLYQLYPKDKTFAFLFVEKTSADLYLARNGKVFWYNKFNYQTEEDLLYYVLYTLEQNRFLATELELKVAGQVLKGEKLYKLLGRYIGSVKELPIPLGFELSSQISPQEMKNQINLIGAL